MLVTELGREPTADEIAEVTGVDPEEVDSIKRSKRSSGVLRLGAIGGVLAWTIVAVSCGAERLST